MANQNLAVHRTIVAVAMASYLKIALGVLISAVDQGIVSSASVELMAGLTGNMITEDAELTELPARPEANSGPW